jgi:hypothetical protein
MRNDQLSPLNRASTLLCLLVVFTQAACVPLRRSELSRSAPPPLPANSLRFEDKHQEAVDVDPKMPMDLIEKNACDHLMAKDFDSIERDANAARKNKQRLSGGYWKLDAIYEGLTTFFSEFKGQEVCDEMWKNRLDLLRLWKEKRPKSITARVALAEGYIGYGWFARGSGYANTVSDEDFRLLGERLEMARNELVDAEQIGPKCPRWYREMLFLGMANGWPLKEFNNVYDEAVHTWPDYLQVHIVKSESLTPKWNGKPGDWQEFLDSLPGKLAILDTDEADIVYFVVAANKTNDSSAGINWAMVSKERIKKGFSDLDKKYGADNLRLNQFAYLSCLTMDFQSAHTTFDRIGDEWNKDVWENKPLE